MRCVTLSVQERAEGIAWDGEYEGVIREGDVEVGGLDALLGDEVECNLDGSIRRHVQRIIPVER